MNGLRPYARDGSLPAKAGDEALCAPSESEVLDTIERSLVSPGAARPIFASLCYARWKPHTSITTSHAVRFDDGTQQLVSFKRYLGEKVEHVQRHARRQGEGAAALDERTQTFLFVFPTDRVLRGLDTGLDLRKTVRFLRERRSLSHPNLRWRRSNATLLRYKPERRAVLRLELAHRAPDGSLGTTRIAMRVLPQAAFERVRTRRHELEQLSDLAPRLLACDERHGLLFEPWLDIEPSDPNDFSRARGAGRLLAELHRIPVRFSRRTRPAVDLGPLEALRPDLVPEARAWVRDEPERAEGCLSHGDVHPDQLVVDKETGTCRWIDWDEMDVAPTHHDLASWIADHLAAEARTSFSEAASPLLEGYLEAGGAPPAECDLYARVRRELVLRACSVARRLQAGAVPRIEALIERARLTRRAGART